MKKQIIFILIFAVIVEFSFAQTYIDTILYANGECLVIAPEEFNFKFNNDTLIFWGRIIEYCCGNHYFIININNDTIHIDKYTPNPCDCSCSFVFFTKIPNCTLNSYKFILNYTYGEFDTIIDNNISSSTEYIDTVLYATEPFSDNPENQQFNINFENDTITFTGKVASSYDDTPNSHYFIIEIRNDTILLERYDLAVIPVFGLYDFSLKIPNCTLNTYNFILRSLYISGFDTIITQNTSINKFKKNNYNIRYYPNPSSGKLTIKGDNILAVEIIDVYGRKIENIQSFENWQGLVKIDLSQQAKSLYFVKVTTNIGTAVEKIIIH